MKTSTTSVNPGMAREHLVAWIGLDWADNQHQISIHDIASGQVESYALKHSPETLQRWLDDLRKRYSGGKVGVVLEQSRGGVLYALMNCDFVVLYPVNPLALASYRKAFYTSGAKDDPRDATLLPTPPPDGAQLSRPVAIHQKIVAAKAPKMAGT